MCSPGVHVYKCVLYAYVYKRVLRESIAWWPDFRLFYSSLGTNIQNLVRRIRCSRFWFSAQNLLVPMILLNPVGFVISTRPQWLGGNILYQLGTSAHRWGWPLNICAWFIGLGGACRGFYDSLMNEKCHKWVMSQIMSHVLTSQVTHVNKSCHTCHCVMSRIWTSQVTHGNESWHTCEWAMSRMWMSHVTHV